MSCPRASACRWKYNYWGEDTRVSGRSRNWELGGGEGRPGLGIASDPQETQGRAGGHLSPPAPDAAAQSARSSGGEEQQGGRHHVEGECTVEVQGPAPG